jgi:hypothetical protein
MIRNREPKSSVVGVIAFEVRTYGKRNCPSPDKEKTGEGFATAEQESANASDPPSPSIPLARGEEKLPHLTRGGEPVAARTSHPFRVYAIALDV